jgi:hypothetical protein
MSEQPQQNSKTFWSVLPSLFVCATIAFIAYLVVSSNSSPPRRLWMPVLVEANGRETVVGETRQMEFWTPSAKTKDYLHQASGEVAKNERWEVISNDDPVMQFGALLHSNLSVVGYRRVEVWGQGRSAFKPGWWWTLNVFTNYTVSDLAHTYQNHWKMNQPVFIEVIDNRGSEEK